MRTARRTPSSAATDLRPVAVLVGIALALRLPALLATRHLSFDDGVYGASAVAMRDGEIPFRDVFSSQGPLFLPLVWLADRAGLRTLDAPRVLALAAGAGLVAATWAAARALRLSPGAALLAAGLVATSGSVLWVTGPLTSDGPALALATAAVALALAHSRSPSARLALLAGLALGAAVSVKSLLVAAAVPVGLALLRERRHLGAAGAAAVAVGLLTTLPFGPAAVWDQSVAYHLEAAGARTPVANVTKATSTLADRDLPLLVAVAGVGAVLAARSYRRSKTAHSAPFERRLEKAGERGLQPTLLVATWVGATTAILLLEHPLWRNHLAHLVPPAVLLVGAGADAVLAHADMGRRQAAVLALALALVVPYHLAHTRPVLWPARPARAEAAARADLVALPPGAWAISDEPGLVWREGRRTPGDLVDTSVLRIDSGRITAASLAAEAADPRVCAVLVWSSRFGRLTELPALLEGYREARRYGGPRVLYVKEPCA